MKLTKSWLEARITTSRIIVSIDNEKECREIAGQRGIILNENAIEHEVEIRRAARQKWQKTIQRNASTIS